MEAILMTREMDPVMYRKAVEVVVWIIARKYEDNPVARLAVLTGLFKENLDEILSQQPSEKDLEWARTVDRNLNGVLGDEEVSFLAKLSAYVEKLAEQEAQGLLSTTCTKCSTKHSIFQQAG